MYDKCVHFGYLAQLVANRSVAGSSPARTIKMYIKIVETSKRSFFSYVNQNKKLYILDIQTLARQKLVTFLVTLLEVTHRYSLVQ